MPKEPKIQKDQKQLKELDSNDLRKQIDKIVDQLLIQHSSREAVTEIVTYLSNEYGVKKPIVRKVATIIFKNAIDTIAEESEECNSLIDKYNARN